MNVIRVIVAIYVVAVLYVMVFGTGVKLKTLGKIILFLVLLALLYIESFAPDTGPWLRP